MSLFLIPFFIMPPPSAQGRSINRRSTLRVPQLRVWYDHDEQKRSWSVRSDRLEEHPLFHTFNRQFFDEHLLPSESITFRNSVDQVDGEKLNELVEHLLTEVQAGKKQFTHFTPVGAKNFNKRNQYGLLILKFRDYPFILKLFIETPASFVDPYTKGLESMCFFFMGGGVNRHMMGFTRIKNLETIREKIALSPEWGPKTDVPRKWFWLPKNSLWLRLHGENIAFPGQRVTTNIPAIYGIIADAIDPVRKFSLLSAQDKKIALDLSNFLEILIDAHIDNFMIEKQTNKIVIVDTEYFPMLVGLKEGLGFRNYFDYFTKLSIKFLRDAYGHTKHQRHVLRSCSPIPPESKTVDFSQAIMLAENRQNQTSEQWCCSRTKKMT